MIGNYSAVQLADFAIDSVLTNKNKMGETSPSSPKKKAFKTEVAKIKRSDASKAKAEEPVTEKKN
jgi:hypothetical protein